MLADDICNYMPRSEYPIALMQPVLKRIKAAQKYVLAPQFAAVADAVMLDYTSLVRAFPFCRLPYSEIWIEVAHMDRPEFAAAEMQAPKFQFKPSRIGYLCSALNTNLSAWKTHLFWSFSNGHCNAAAMSVRFDMQGTLNSAKAEEVHGRGHGLDPQIFTTNIPDHPGWTSASNSVKEAMLNHTQPSVTDYGLPLSVLAEYKNTKLLSLIAQFARSDWAGESAFLLAVIGLMNARNAIEIVNVDQTRLNKARQRRGELPLFKHHILKIHTRQQQRVNETGSGQHAAIRGHFVSGHWKVRRTGIFFWHPHARGDFKRGAVSKDYEVVE